MAAIKGQAKPQTKPEERGTASFKEFPNNPRKISRERLMQLGESLSEFGSLDGFVINLAEGKYKDCIISGNQKNKHVNLSEAEIEISKRYEKPTTAGTVGVGYVVFNGERFPYREVLWSERKCEIANLRANNYGGENDRDLLLTFDSEILELGGVDLVFEDFRLSFGQNTGEVIDSGEFGTGFSLPDGDREPFQQMTFTLSDEQATVVKNAIAKIKESAEFRYAETMGNQNSNGNALYLIVATWEGQRI